VIGRSGTGGWQLVHPDRVTPLTRLRASIGHAGDQRAVCAPGPAVVLTDAAGLAVLAALTPTAVLVTAVFLGSASPRRTVLIFLAGAIVMTAVMATIVFIVLHAGHVYKPRERPTRYGVRLGLGLLILIAGGYLWRRGPKRRDPAKKDTSMISRLLAKPGGRAAFIVGLIVYSPSLTFVAAVQVIATAQESIAVSILNIAVVIAITIAFVWLPLVLYLLAPERTGRLLGRFNGWLRSHGHVLAVGALAVGGTVLTINGILGVTGVVG
jgi:Sap, sulfolipid-1-addressing protein